MKVLHVTGEVAPYSKTGGLGDVLGELPPAQRALGIEARVVTPLYGFIDRSRLRRGRTLPEVHLGGRTLGGRLWHDDDRHIAFVDLPGLLDRPHNYGGPGGEYADNPLRFGAFCKVAAGMAGEADVFHLHDWQAGLAAMYLGGRRPVVLTVHNLAYQGLCGFEWADRLGVPRALRTYEGVEYYGRVSLLKAGLVLADRLTTVSPTYAAEIQKEPGGMGLAGLFRHRRRGLDGIINGIDTDDWNPASDPALPEAFSADDLGGRAACTAALRAELKLGEGPIFGVISRAAGQKGLDLLVSAAPRAIASGARFAVLASGEPSIMQGLDEVAAQHPGAFAVVDRFDLDLARRIYGGADFITVPSRYEPCGLTQLIGMRYGAIPVVRRTGGLADTVVDGETGLCFDEASAEALGHAIDRALAMHDDARAAMRARCMAQDWSWAGPAAAYRDIYRRFGGLEARP